MRRLRTARQMVTIIVAVTFSFMCIVVAPVQAAMIGTADILPTQNDDAARQKVKLFLERQDVTQHLSKWGVDADEAKIRVDSMTDEEVNLLANKIDEIPAGGGILEIILVIAVVGFIVLIVLDIVGVTDIFTFIKKR